MWVAEEAAVAGAVVVAVVNVAIVFELVLVPD